MLVANLEGKNDISPGVELCDSGPRGYGNAIVVGTDRYGSFVGPGI